MEKIFLLIQESNVDGEILINVTPCATIEIARKLMKQEVDTLLSEKTSKYYGIDLDYLEKCTQDEEEWDYDFNVDRAEDHIYITCNVDNYYEWIDIEEKEIVKKD